MRGIVPAMSGVSIGRVIHANEGRFRESRFKVGNGRFMKKSLIWRFVVIILVVLGWAYSLFPLKDRDFIEVFQSLAVKNLAQFAENVTEATEAVVAAEAKLAAEEDKESDAYRELEEEKADAESKKTENEELIASFADLVARAEAKLAAEEDLAPSLAIRECSKGGTNQKRVILNRFIAVPTQPKASNDLVLSHVRRRAAGKLHLGLDLQGGTEFIIGFDPKQATEQDRHVESVRNQIIEILRNRVDIMGVVEPELKPIGPSSISLRMPSVKEERKAMIRKTIKETAKLEFRLVDPNNAQKVAEYRQDAKAFRPTRGYEYFEMKVESDEQVDTEILFLKSHPERLSGEDVSRAVPNVNEFGNYSVSLSFKSKGAAAFAKITKDNVGERLAILMDGKVYSAPVIREAIMGGNAEISGSFSAEEATRLAGVIESGNLPVTIAIDSEFGTDPTLGRASIDSGVMAATVGLALVLLFMIWYYRLAGVVAIAALAVNVLLIMGTLTLTGATITLPGIAGIVLTIGMAVDANVLIFERIREELLNGKTIGNAVKSGYNRAFVTILDSNLTTLLTALILYRFGSGPIRGFAVTLSCGIVASMFTALFMTRCVFDWRLYLGKLKKLTMVAWVKQDINIDFLGMKKHAIVLSAVLMGIGLIAGCVGCFGGKALSIDFAGGTEVTYSYTAESGTGPDTGVVEKLLKGKGFENCRIGYKYSVTSQGRLLEIVLPERSTDEVALDSDAEGTGLDLDKITSVLNEGIEGTEFRLVQTNSVGGLVGAQFKKQAVAAAFLAAIGIIIYISFRFELAYAIASVAALIHDVVIAGGLFILCGFIFGGRQISLPVVAALLTIMGYSLNDTIVVFDRIREDLTLHKGRSYTDIINLSINQTLSRTLLTSFTTLLVVLTLYFFGGGAINDFALVMLIGVVVGTYSSIFVASTIISLWHKHARGHADA